MSVQEFVTINADVLNGVPEPRQMAAPEALGAIAAHVSREYGEYGYRIGLAEVFISGGGALAVVSHSDGSRLRLYADRWGNVARVPDEVTTP